MKPFYIHHRRETYKGDNSFQRHLPKGFTALSSPVPADSAVPNAERMALFSVTFCSNKDEFSKKKGREAVQDLIPDLVNKRDVPRLLAQALSRVENYTLDDTKFLEANYLYALKYLV